MKNELLCGIAIGMIAGVMLYKYNKDAKSLINKTEKVVMEEVNDLKKAK